MSRCRTGWLKLLFLAAATLPAVAAPASPAPSSADWATFKSTVQPFFEKHCFECHDADTEKGEIRLDNFADDESLTKGFGTIDRAARVIRKHEMPPKKRPRPSDEEIKPVLAWLDAFTGWVDKKLPPDPGRVVVRRLNRAEYNNTVHDLLGVTLRPADEFPPDDSGYGFDNIGQALSVSPVLLEKYLAAAERVARAAVFGVERMKPERVAHEPFCPADAFSRNTSVPSEYDETGMSLPSAIHVTQQFPVEAEYAFRTILRGTRPRGSAPAHVAFWIDGRMVHEATVDSRDRTGEMNGQWAEFRTRVPAGEHWLSVTLLRMYEGLPRAYKGPNPSNTEGNVRVGADAFFPMYLDVIGPYEQVTGPTEESVQRIFTCGHGAKGPHDAACARRILSDLAKRAYRRPVTERETDDLAKLVEMVQADGDPFEEGLCLAIQRMLISPNFLFRLERGVTSTDSSTPKNIRSISDHELATRLSYFLWSSMPDAELLRCADEGGLRKPDVLEAQVRRMLKDPKASALVENFGGQWLMTRALESHLPDRAKFPEYTDYTRLSMRLETELFFQHVIREDRPILDFLDADYTFLNQRLAEYYGIPGVKGHEFRKVDLAGTRRGGGVLTQASVLTVSAYANRTSPVLRGKWILDNLLNAPPPPPPPDVPSLEEKGLGDSVSLRAQLEAHRKNPTCASCHARMDPLGFALEHFDAIGRWREKDGKTDIDSSGTLPDGRSFDGHEGLQKVLRADPETFADCLASKMLLYALGRGPEPYDRTVVRGIVARAARDDYRFSSIVMGVVRSVPFQMIRASESEGAP